MQAQYSGEDVARIPLRDHHGDIRAYAIIDVDDLALVENFRWHLDGLGYATTCVRQTDGSTRNFKLHRILLGLQHGDGILGDHINRDRLDNRRANLRSSTKAQNAQNASPYRGGRSKFRGVSWESATRRWLATITIAGKQRKLGRFANEQDAANAARDARLQLMSHATD